MRTIPRTLAIILGCIIFTSLALGQSPSSVSIASSLNPSTYGSSVTFTATVTPAAATGTVTFTDGGGATLGSGTLSGGVATYSTSTLGGGVHPVTASYGGDSNYQSSTSSALRQTVNQQSSSVAISSSLNPSPYESNVTFTATVTPATATGTVTFKNENVVLGTGTISNGIATYSTSSLTAGTRSIYAIYGGDGNYSGSTSSALAQQVQRLTSTVVTSSSDDPSPYGTSVTFTSTVTPSAATGTVSFRDGSTLLGTGTLSNGIATYSTSTLAVGSHPIRAIYNGDTDDIGSTSPVLTQIVKLASSLTLSSSPNPSTYGSSVTFTSTVSPTTATGTVSFYDSGSPIGSGTISGGTASFSTSSLTVGSHSITASYSGDSTYAGSASSTLTQTVSKLNTAITLTSSSNPSTYGSVVTLTATVAPASATGSVTFIDWSTALGAGTISGGTTAFTISTLSGGMHSITASYGGDGNDNASTSSPLAQTVNPSSTTVALVSSANPSTYGAPVTFTATVTPSTATGTVTFLNGTTTLGTGTLTAGSAGYTTSSLTAGANAITASYGGDTNDGPSASAPLSQVVNSGGFVATNGQMESSRYGQTATQLQTGQILVAGGMTSSGAANSAELYTLSSQAFASTGTMNVARWLHTATLLNDGTVLIAGGSDLANEETLDTAEIYNPAAGTFTLLSNTLNTARVGHTATLLQNGQVLIVGGYDPQYGLFADAELYDPPTQTFIDLGDTNSPRYQHTATMLQNGQVLIAGGDADPTPNAAFNTAELFDLASQTFTSVPVPMTTPREGHAAVLLNSGQVLITGGDIPGSGSLNTAELYDPPSNTFIAITSTMTVPRIWQTATLLNGGKVLISGGADDPVGTSTPLNTAEIYDPVSQTFMAAGNMASAREHQTATLLNDGTVLEAGGTDGTNVFNTAELYMPSQLSGLASITVAPASPSIGVGAQQLFTVVGTFNDGSTESLASVLWSSSNPSVATIGNDATNPGAAASLAQGTATITASAAGISETAALTITGATLVSIQLSPQNPTVPIGATQQFTATGIYTDGSTQDLTSSVTWSTSASVVSTINGSGLAAGLFEGVATIQASFGSANANTNLNVSVPALASIAISPAGVTIPNGTSQQYQAIGTYTDGSTQNVTNLVSWTSTITGVATVNNSGLALALSQGATTVTASFESISASVPLTVGAPNLVALVVTPNAGSLATGATQQLTATGNYSDGSAQNLTASTSWASSNTGVLSINNSGLVTAGSVGEARITATVGSINGTSVLVVTSGSSQPGLTTSRYLHSATMLDNGQVLVAGGVNCPAPGSCTYLSSAELYNPASGTFTNAASAMAQARSAPAVLLNNGNVLHAGGYFCDGSGNCSSLSSAEIFSPATGSFTSAGNMTVARSGQTMTLLGNGTVLIAGGETCTSATSCSALSSAEIYDPIAGTFTSTSTSMSAARFGASAVALSSGLVLIAGGFDGTNMPASAELYDPTQLVFTGTGPNLNTPRFNATATLLNNGKVLVAGGSTCNLPGCPTNAAEIYDPVANTFATATGGMIVSRFNHTATLLTNGQVVIAGGFSSCSSSCTSEASTELFDPVAGIFSSSQPFGNAIAGQTATLTANGDSQFIGGINAGVTSASNQWYEPSNLTPPGLVSISVTPGPFFLMPGQTQPLIATGTFTDGSTQTLQSAIWASSTPPAAVVSNSPGNRGMVNALATGSATITATAGDVIGSASLEVGGLVSLAITPANPTVTLGTGQQMTASGTFADGTTQNLTNSITWTSSNTSVLIVGTTSGFQGFAMGAYAGTATVTAIVGSVSTSTSVNVQNPPAVNPPGISSFSCANGLCVGGAQVTISGSNFGATQGTGTVWLGSAYGNVVSWGNTQIIATIASISQSGTAQIQQGGLFSTPIPFNVTTATITGVSPTSGVPGTQVTISGSGFGASQGGGQVWLGTANGVVQSWSDGQIVAEVASGAQSGNAMVLQNGVMSNPVSFTVNSLQIGSVSPTTGGPGTQITITGDGFGATQGNGIVWLGSASGNVMSWSNTQITATVAASAVSGVARVEQNDVWSNAVTFTVPTAGGTLTLNPNMLNMVVGETHNIQALNASGQAITGLTWTSSNAKIVSLSTDDPPVLSALALGHVTITAGSASADVTVSYPGTLPTGTVLWSNPGDGSGVQYIVPAVPSSSGVADIFAFNASGTVSAIASDGTTTWTTNIPGAAAAIPDFQGGLVVPSAQAGSSGATSITKLDGITGQPYPAFAVNPATDSLSYTPGVHTDGTIFTLDYNNYQYACCSPSGQPYQAGTISVIGIDPTTGKQKFSVPLDQSVYTSSGENVGSCPQWYPPAPPPFAGGQQTSAPTVYGNQIIAGDGYEYVVYSYAVETWHQENTYGCGVDQDLEELSSIQSDSTVLHLMTLRVGSDGSFSKIDVKDWRSEEAAVVPESGPSSRSISGTIPEVSTYSAPITNADQGIVVAWEEDTAAYCASYTGTTCNLQVPESSTYHLGTTRGSSASTFSVSSLLSPSLQAQDGSFYGNDSSGNMIKFNQSGSTIWSVPGDYPQIATADGGVIGASGITYDSQGRATGQVTNMPTYAWTGDAYRIDPANVLQISSTPVNMALNFWPMDLANNSLNSTAFKSTVETLYLRSFAPWQMFGPEFSPKPFSTNYICFADCFYGDNRSFSTSTDPSVTSRITKSVSFLVPGMTVYNDPAPSSDQSRDKFGRTATGSPTGSATSQGGTIHVQFKGSNPLAIAPSIVTQMDISGKTGNGQVCYSGKVYGDAFPNAESFLLNSQSQAVVLDDFSTSLDRNWGPLVLLNPINIIPMGSFSNICVAP